MSDVVVSYVNPDLDGIACAVALQSIGGSSWIAHRFGNIDDETQVVLGALRLAVPPQLTSWHGVDRIWLVDTHHLNQLPADFPADLVIRITDHHPGGDMLRFPKANAQNEPVGAAATLVAERILERGEHILPDIAILLQAAIVSNTLEFQVPATSPRDHSAYEKLRAVCPLEGDLLDLMREARRGALKLSSGAIILKDTKLYETVMGLVAVSQIEAPGALEILGRADLASSLVDAAASKAANAALLNIVDIALHASAIVSTDPSLLRHLAKKLCESIDADGVIRCERILQRKTDIVPYLLCS